MNPNAHLDSLRRRRGGEGPTLKEAIASGFDHARELGDYLKTWIDVRSDRAALEFRRKSTGIALGVVAAFGLVTIVIAASLRVVVGLSAGLAVLFGGRAWLGDLLAGVLLLGGLAGAAKLYLSARERKDLVKAIEKYERQHREHRERHGRHVGDTAAAEPRRAPRP